MLRVLIVDDEPLARRGLRQLLAAHPGVSVAGEAGDVDEALEIIAAERPDVVFLDIELGEETENGFALIARLAAPPRIVCVTAHARHAVEAFAVAATDFLLKPVSPLRLAETLARLARPPVAVGPEPLTLRTPGRTVVVAPADIAALRADGDFTHVLMVGQAPLMILRTLAAFEAVLPAPPFLRVGRSLILNRDRVQAVEMPAGGQALVRLAGLEAPVPIARSAALRLRASLTGPAGTA